jgi:Bacillus/Clostridium GerA spore germination protein.
MIDFIARKLKYLFKNGVRSVWDESAGPELSGDLMKNMERLKTELGESADLKVHEFIFGANDEYSAALFYIDGLVDTMMITEGILKPLTGNKNIKREEDITVTADYIKKTVVCSGDVKCSGHHNELVKGVLNGNTILLFEGYKTGLVIDTKGWETRPVAEPQTESVVRGPREGFTENLRTNTSLIRRKIKNPRLRFESMQIGKKSATEMCVVYLEGVAKKEIIDTVKQRLEAVNIDAILDTGYIEELIEDNPFSLFSTIGYTEKPDVAASKILEGRVAIIADGTPFVLTVPMLFQESFQTAEDYYNRPLYASLTRIMRIIAFLISILIVPGFIALATFHQEFIPPTLLITIAAAREGTPFPTAMEALLMVFTFEILREAGLRLPRPVGQAISIVGALVMGDAAVAAGLVGSMVVIVVSIAAVSGFTVPSQADSISILRFLFIFVTAFFGGFGLALCFLGLLAHLASLKSFGVPYFGATKPDSDQQDAYVRMPLWFMVKRPQDIAGNDKHRLKKFVPPEN